MDDIATLSDFGLSDGTEIGKAFFYAGYSVFRLQVANTVIIAHFVRSRRGTHILIGGTVNRQVLYCMVNKKK